MKRSARVYACPRYFAFCGVLAVTGLAVIGCSELTGANQQLPSGTTNPSFYNTPTGALGMRDAAIYLLEQALPSYLTDTGLLTDELGVVTPSTSENTGTQTSFNLPSGTALDERILPTGGSYPSDGDYNNLQQVRGSITQALGQLATYDTGASAQGNPQALRGELYALEGYTEILLADFFCSGVPLSTLDFQKDFTYQAGSTTDAVYADAERKLDSALTLATLGDSVPIQELATVLQGRALLDRGLYDSAATVVQAVPTGFKYRLPVKLNNFNPDIDMITTSFTEVSDIEGGTGLPYRSSRDPRTAATDTTVSIISGSDMRTYTEFIPNKYVNVTNAEGYNPVTVADGIEARLIQAEAALRGNPTAPMWLTILNQLRTNGTYTLVNGETIWNAGTGGVNGLGPLTDPGGVGLDSARVGLLFQERAYWLYLTGHREGDLRRLLRQYGSLFHDDQAEVYPSGPYAATNSEYGSAVVAPIPVSEYPNNLFKGCLSYAP